MPRAQFRDTVLLRSLNGTLVVPPSGAGANLYDAGTSNAIAEPIYADNVSPTTLTNPVPVGADGALNFWLAEERELDVVVACPGYTPLRTTVTTDGMTPPFGATGFSDGIPAAPSIFFASDTNTGLYHPAPDTIGFTTGGMQRAVVSAAGVQAAIIDQGGQVYNVKAYGAKGDGVTDDTVAIQKALNAAQALGGATVVVPTGVYILTDTLDWTHFANVALWGPGQIGGAGGGASLKWNGPAGGIVHKMYQARDNLIEGIQMLAGSATPGVYVDMDQPPGYTTNCTHNTLRRVRMATFSIAGVRIGLAGTANCDLNIFDDVAIETGPSGYLFNNVQSKFNLIQGGNIAFCTTAGINNTQGSFTSINTNFSNNALDINVAIDDACTIIQPQSESAGRFLDRIAGGASTGCAHTIVGGRLDTNNVNADGDYIRVAWSGPLNLVGVDFASGVNRPAVRIHALSGSASINATGCIFSNNTPWTTDGASKVHQLGCGYVDGAGHTVQLADRWDGGFTDGTAAAPSIFFTSDVGSNTGLYWLGEDQIGISTGGVLRWQANASGHFLAGADGTYDIGAVAANRPRNVYIGSGIAAGGNITANGSVSAPQAAFTNYVSLGASPAYLAADAANTLAQRNGTSPQTLRIYNTYTDVSNYERLTLSWVGNNAYLRPEASGTGTIRTLTIVNRVKAGVPVDADVASPADGMCILDTTNNKIMFRCGGTWKGVAIA
jgi:Pectate lyase superfamily protein